MPRTRCKLKTINNTILGTLAFRYQHDVSFHDDVILLIKQAGRVAHMDDTNISIRPAEFRDAQGIFDLIKSFPQELIPRAIGDIVQNIDRFLIAERNARVVGVVSWQIMPEIGGTDTKHSVEIKSVAVDVSCHGKGIGRRLVHAAIERIRPLHTSEIIVLTFSPPFFETLGFREVPKETLMHKIYTGCINCTKYDSPFTCPEVAMVLPME